MSRTFLPAMALCLATVTCLFADDFSGFRIPSHRVYGLSGNLSSILSSSRTRRPDGDMSEGQRNDQAQGTGRISGYYLTDSDPFRLGLSISGQTAANYNYSEYLNKYGERDRYLTQSLSNAHDVQEQFSVSGDTRMYPWQSPLGFLANWNLQATYQQRWSHGGNSNGYHTSYDSTWWGSDTRTRGSNWQYLYGVTADAGIGYGRVRDVSSVYTIYVMRDRLKEAGAITRDLSSAAMQRLEDLFYFSGAYATVHDRSSKFFWEQVERILREDGVLADNALTAHAIYRIAEGELYSANHYLRSGNYDPGDNFAVGAERAMVRAMQPMGFLRQRGYFAGIVAEAAHSNTIRRISSWQHDDTYRADTLFSRSDTTTVTRTQRFEDLYAVGPFAEFHLPLGMRWQIDVLGEALYPLNNGSNALVLRDWANATYLLSDRWRADLLFAHSRQILDDNSATTIGRLKDSWWVSAQAGIRYYIEDHLNINLILQQYQGARSLGGFSTITTGDFYPEMAAYHRDYAVSLGFTYHILGALEAPGIVPASTLMPWPAR